MKIAVVGAGVSGNLVARLLATQHQVTLFEANGYYGGHTNTVDVPTESGAVAVDTGFMVFNRRTYPNFCRMLDLLNVESQPSDMSFSVRCDETNLEYNGTSLNGLFAQRQNLFRPRFYQMLLEVLRFNRLAREASQGDGTLGEFIRRHRFRDSLWRFYLRPMLAAIWSAPLKSVDDLPAKFVLGFMHNHGLLQIRDRPQWRTIVGGAKNYVQRLLAPLKDRRRTHSAVASIVRHASGVSVHFRDEQVERFDQVVLATHADTSLGMLAEPSRSEREVLGEFPYQPNRAVLHSDANCMPRRRIAWASWNYHLTGSRDMGASATLTYDLNRLQNLRTQTPIFVTLNPEIPIPADRVWQTISYSHPGFTLGSVAAQHRWGEINSTNRTWYCGAYWGYGFHEDGVNSALRVAEAFGMSLDDINQPVVESVSTQSPSPLASTP